MLSNVQQSLADFYSDLNKISLPEDAIKYSEPLQKVLTSEKEQAMPLIKLCPPRVNATEFFRVLQQVAGIIREKHPEMGNELSIIEAALPIEKVEQELFAAQAFVPDINLLTSQKLDLPPETFGFLLNHTIKPFIVQYAQKVTQLRDLDQWLHGNCPVCGSRPTFSLLDKEDGKRYLYCGLCEVKWRFQRLGCPFCLNSESQFFTAEGMEKYRVYFCDHCHGYIKTLDERKAGGEEIDLFWEDIKTVPLDILAIKEGYCK
ncbi:MAG: formate dehydrogenase accessory protein FdhE [Pelotomaculum sp. PtaB.Bin104]|nr:MAG: formate dehydrogenase accessory protein FdhE [Pelotomaculum sp. PtaB.Bin104]